METVTVTTPVASPTPPKRSVAKKLMLSLVAVVAAGIAYVGVTNPGLFRAALLETTVPAGASYLYIPNYTAGATDSGLLSVKVKQAMDTQVVPEPLASENLVSLNFKLKWTPANAVVLNENSIVFDAGTLFQSADLKSVNTSVPGEAIISFFSSNKVLVDTSAVDTVLKLNVQLNGTPGSDIVLQATDVEAIQDSSATATPNYVASVSYTAIDAGKITVQTQDNLRVLNAEAIDSTHVVVRYSDLLQNIGGVADYQFDNGLVATDVVTGYLNGYDQKAVIVTTGAQNPGVAYSFEVINANVKGNTQGGLATNYKKAKLFGFGNVAAALSTFAVTSAQATDYNKVELTFSDAVVPASVDKTGFDVKLVGGATATVTDATLANGKVVLTTQGNLLKKNTYLVTVAGVRRASDNALIGLGTIAVAGYKNGPQLTGATLNGADLTLAFDESVSAAPNAHIGGIVLTGTEPSVVSLDPALVSGNQLVIPNVATVPETNYTVVLNTALANAAGLPLDPDFGRATFWGATSVTGPGAIGAVTVTRKDAVEIAPGTLNFSGLTAANVDLFTMSDVLAKTSIVPSSVSIAAGKLRIVTPAVLAPEGRYIVLIKNGSTQLGASSFSVPMGFEVTGVTVVDRNRIVVQFNENVDQDTVSAAKFTLDPAVAVTSATVQAGFQSVLLQLGGNLSSGVYTVKANTGSTGVRSYDGGKIMSRYATAFAGYQVPSNLSTVTLNSVDVDSGTRLTLHFSGDLQANSVTPVNLLIEKFGGAGLEPLTVAGATLRDARTIEVTTAQQGSDVNYFVTMNGVRDSAGLPLGNARVLNFFGFVVGAVSIHQVNPNSVTNEAERLLVVVGEHLDTVDTARLGNTAVVISDQTAGALSLTVPSGFAVGNYALNLLTQTGETVSLSNALTVQAPVSPMRLISDESRAIPNRAAPDGATPVKFWVLVEDPVALNQISSVNIDLEQIGGSRAQEMAKDAGLQPQYRQFYTYQTTIAATTPTSTTPIQLPVQVRKGAEVVSGTVEVLVTREVLQSVAPTIGQAYVIPATIAPDGESTVEVSARVTDPDGIDTISSVIADLGPLGLGFVTLTSEEAAPAAGANPTTVGVFSGVSRVIAKTVREQSYNVTVTAQDNTGASGTAQVTVLVSNSANAPVIDSTKSYLSPRKSVPRDGKTTFSIHAMVTNADGISEVDSVNAYFGTSGIAPVALVSDPTASMEGKSALYSSGPIVIPSTVPLGVQDIEVVATNKKGGRGNLILQVDVTNKDTLGEAPIVQSAKAYTTPKIALNDGKTPITLYTFVRDDDNNLESVVVNLTGVGQVGPEIPADFGEVGAPQVPMEGGAGGCPTGSNTIVCMTPSFKEGNLGQWYVLSGVTISKDTATSVQPYKVEVIATDASGSVTRGEISVSVRDNLTAAADKTPLEVVAAVPVGSGTVQVVFGKPLDAMTVAAKEFGITDSTNISLKLNVLGATIDASGMVVTLTTDNQVKGTDYVLTASTKITDSAGMALVPGRKSQATFKAYEDSDKVPVVDFIGATDGETVQIDFQANIRPSSVKMGGDFGIKIVEVDTETSLAVKGVRFVESGKSIEVKTEMQKSNTRYRLTLSSVESASGIAVKNPITRFFKSINIRAVQKAAVASGADLNGDGKVDFIDFTMFSAVYGQSLAAPVVDSGMAGEGDQGLSPIAPTPDSTVPHTTPPAVN